MSKHFSWLLLATVLALALGGAGMVGGVLAGAQAAPPSAPQALDVWRGTGPFGGVIQSFAIAAQSPFTLYAGTPTRGAYRSGNGGASWTDITAGLGSNNVRALATSPFTPNTVYAAGNDDVYRSSNAGATWLGPGTGITGSINALSADPFTPGTLYIASTSGLFKSENGGATWLNKGDGITQSNVMAILPDPLNANTIYAGSNPGTVYKTINGGTSWTRMDDGLTAGGVYALAGGAPGGKLYVATNAGVFQTDNGGVSWHNLGGFGSVARALAISPLAPSVLYAGGDFGVLKVGGGITWTQHNTGFVQLSVNELAIHPQNAQTLFAGMNGSGVFRTTNGAALWSDSNQGITATQVQALAADPRGGMSVFAGTAGYGVLKSTDGGATWASASNGLLNPFVYSLALDPLTPTTMYAGSYAGNPVHKSVDGGGTWTRAFTGMVGNISTFELIVHPTQTQRLYAATYASGAATGAFYRSTNGAMSWVSATFGLTTTLGRALARDSLGRLLIGTESGIWSTIDDGDTWVRKSNGLGTGAVYGIAVHPLNPMVLLAGTDGNGIYRSTNGGDSWTPVPSPSSVINRVIFGRFNPNHAYATTFGNGILRSLDGGSTWTFYNSGLPGGTFNAIIDTPFAMFAGSINSGAYLTERLRLNLPAILR